MKKEKVPQLQLKFIHNFLSSYFGQHHQISNQLIEVILAFVFSSPLRQNNIFVLKQGHLLLKYKNKMLRQNNFVLSNSNEEIVKVKSPIFLKQHDQLMIANKFHQNERIRITRIWKKPATRTQKKILTYCGMFKQFLIGKHHQSRTIDLRYLNRQFLVPDFEKDQFSNHSKNIEENDAHFCSFDVLDSYMALVTKNYIEIQVQQNVFNDDHRKVYKVVPQGSDVDIFEGIKLIFMESEKKWQFKGDNLVIWLEQKIFTRKPQLIKTLDGKVDLVESNRIKSVDEFQFLFQQNIALNQGK